MNRKILYIYMFLFGWIVVFTSCTKEEVTQTVINKQIILDAEYVYELNNVTLYQDGIKKPNSKTLNEFASIAWTELFGTSMDDSKLNALNYAHVSFGDKKMIEDLLIRNFLNESGVQIPTKTDMLNDIDVFVENTYKKLYGRYPNEFEAWQLKEFIQNNNTEVNPELIYYTFMTSNEYRYY